MRPGKAVKEMKKAETTKKNGAKNKSVERNVEVDVVTTAHKVSTGCGPSPPRDVHVEETETAEAIEEITLPVEDNEVEEPQTEEVTTPVRKISTSVGTSPPPQCAGTQVCYYPKV